MNDRATTLRRAHVQRPVAGPSRASAAFLVLRAMRFPQWWHFLTLPLAPLAAAGSVGSAAIRPLVLATLGAAGCLAFAFGLNAVTDRSGDRSRRKNPLAGRRHVPATVHVAIAASAVLGLCSSALLGTISLLAAGLSLVSGLAYSAGPRLKARPGLGTACNALIFTPLLALGASRAALSGPLLGLAGVFAVLLTQNQLLHEIADREEDVGAGSRTSAGVLGPRRARALAAALGLLGAVVALVAGAFGLGALDLRAVGAAAGLLLGSAVTLWPAPTPTVARTRHRWASAAILGGLLLALGAPG